jgi:hypothetical protein
MRTATPPPWDPVTTDADGAHLSVTADLLAAVTPAIEIAHLTRPEPSVFSTAPGPVDAHIAADEDGSRRV